MTDELKRKMELPAHIAVLVCEVRSGGALWPISRVDIRSDDHAAFESGAANAPKIIAALEKTHACAVRKATTLVAESMIAKLGIAAEPVDSPFNAHPNSLP